MDDIVAGTVEGDHPGIDYDNIRPLHRTEQSHISPGLSTEAEDHIRQELGTRVLRDTRQYGRGYICSGATYETDHGPVFIKINKKPLARTMFDGEYSSLVALRDTGIVTVPKPIKIEGLLCVEIRMNIFNDLFIARLHKVQKSLWHTPGVVGVSVHKLNVGVIERPEGGAMLVMEYMDLSRNLDKHSAELGHQIARLHLQNGVIGKAAAKGERSVHKDGRERTYMDTFGFDVNTCCGYLEMDNNWCDTWPMFFARMVEVQMARIDKNVRNSNMLKQYGDRHARQLWNIVVDKLPTFFEGLCITPALLHGDLWEGNIAENDDGPIVYDTCSFYGHCEFDMCMSELFDGFSPSFLDAYHRLVPKQPGFAKRLELYKLFCHLNRWNHFGVAHRDVCISALQTCAAHAHSG